MNEKLQKLKNAGIIALYIIGANILFVVCCFIDAKVLDALCRLTR